MQNETLLNEKQAAEFLTVVPRTLQSWRAKGVTEGSGPVFLKIGRLIRYRKIDLEDWIKSRVRTSTSDTGKAK